MGTPDHLVAFWRPARLLPWKRIMWGAVPRAVAHAPLLPDAFVLQAEYWELDSAIRDDFRWDGTYPE